ncbi:MAG TPA: glycosyltransferase family 39 protein [Pyrinomonadaceae bacterium]|nr:glycosyltransferase family 39 protein [Pyrinomonadaceae bacterium]
MLSLRNPAESFRRQYPYWLSPALVALILTIVYLNPFIGDWDGLDYTIFSLHGRPSSMALGRSLFTLSNFVLYRFAHALAGFQPQHAYLLFKYLVVIETPLAVIACWIFARDLTGSDQSATLASLMIACSPILVIYGGQVMTEIPSVLFTALALAIHLRGIQKRQWWLMLAGAALLGLGVNLRETVGLYAPWLIIAPFVGGWKFDRRTVTLLALSLVIFAVVAIGPFAVWYEASPIFRLDWHTWLSSMQSESDRHPISIGNLKPFLIYFFMCAPLVTVGLPFAVWKEWRERGFTLALLAALIGVAATVMLFFNYSTTINWRYFLTGLPAMAPLAGDFYARIQARRFRSERRGFVSAVIGIAFIAALMIVLVPPAGNEYFNRLAQAKTYDLRLKLIPRDAVVIAGAQTIAVQYWRGIGLGEWDWIGVGAGWPAGQLESKIDEHLKAGRRVFLDADPRWWLPCEWHLTEVRELAAIETHFHFKQIAPTIYEIRLLDDQSVTDHPHLENLLPENRPEEVKKCFDSG